MKKIGFLSFGHWTPSPQSQTRSASDALLLSIDLAVAAEELGTDGAYFRVHHFARQLSSPFPLLAARGSSNSINQLTATCIATAVPPCTPNATVLLPPWCNTIAASAIGMRAAASMNQLRTCADR